MKVADKPVPAPRQKPLKEPAIVAPPKAVRRTVSPPTKEK